MLLSELVAYAKETYQMEEEFKWPDFPGFSVLTNPKTGKWVAVLMRQWDSARGAEVERCDIKCGQFHLYKYRNYSCFDYPFRMKGQSWLGIKVENVRETGFVLRLFDKAVRDDNKRCGVDGRIISSSPEIKASVSDEPEGIGPYSAFDIDIGAPWSNAEDTGAEMPMYHETSIPVSDAGVHWERPGRSAIPEKIREMKRLYKRGDGSFLQKCKNFYTQGMFMKDYEDDFSWNGVFVHYFPTYYDMPTEVLRGYFSWRTQVRKGIYKHTDSSIVYIYIYELLNLIGTESPMDSINKMILLKKNYFTGDLGERGLLLNLEKWMFEFAVMHQLPLEIILGLADRQMIETDWALEALDNPHDHSDDTVFRALCCLTKHNLPNSSVYQKMPDEGKHLFAEVWRYACDHYSEAGNDIYTDCFDKMMSRPWHPLGNAVYLPKGSEPEICCRLSTLRCYTRKNGIWREECHESVLFNRVILDELVHEADRALRAYLKTGHPLRERDDEAWAKPYVEAVIEADKKARIEAARPRVHIDFAELDSIRRNAEVTRDSLLTEDEIEDDGTPDGIQSADACHAETDSPAVATPVPPVVVNTPVLASDDGDIWRCILSRLLNGAPVSQLIAENHLMVSVVADRINELWFDEIGDNILECDGEQLTIVEDYREDIERILK